MSAKKIAFVINGKGGVGKDSVCDAVASKWKTRNISSITPIKYFAKQMGWTGAKDDRDRKFLSDLKQLLVDYCDLPQRYCVQMFKEFMASADEEIMFIHIREPENIKRFIKSTDYRCLSLLVRRKAVDGREYGNKSDDNVEDYDYDYVYNNDKSLEEMPEDVISFMLDVIAQEERKEYPHSF